jgi:general stress protein 26
VKTDDQTHRDHLYRLLEDFSVAMIITHGIDETMIGRPMAIARVDREGAMYFLTPVHSTKVDEVLADPHVTVVVQSKTQYAAVRGLAKVSTDPALIHTLWKEEWKHWFPRGKDDPQIAILVFEPHHGEYWDNAGATGLKLVFAAAKAYMAGRMPNELEEHAEVDMKLR